MGEKVLICMKSVSLLPRSNRPLLCRRTSLSFVSASASTHYFIPFCPETSLQSSQYHPVTSFLSRGRRFSKLNFFRLLEYSLFRSHGCKLCMSGYLGYQKSVKSTRLDVPRGPWMLPYKLTPCSQNLLRAFLLKPIPSSENCSREEEMERRKLNKRRRRRRLPQPHAACIQTATQLLLGERHTDHICYSDTIGNLENGKQ